MRDTFIKALCSICEENKDVELITGDLGFGVLKPFFAFPKKNYRRWSRTLRTMQWQLSMHPQPVSFARSI